MGLSSRKLGFFELEKKENVKRLCRMKRIFGKPLLWNIYGWTEVELLIKDMAILC